MATIGVGLTQKKVDTLKRRSAELKKEQRRRVKEKKEKSKPAEDDQD